MCSVVVPSRGAIRVRSSRLVNPWGSSRWLSRACSRAWARASPKRSPGMRVPVSVTIGAVRLVNAWAPWIGLWLRRWTPSRRRLAVDGDLVAEASGRPGAGVGDQRLVVGEFQFEVLTQELRQPLFDFLGFGHRSGKPEQMVICVPAVAQPPIPRVVRVVRVVRVGAGQADHLPPQPPGVRPIAARRGRGRRPRRCAGSGPAARASDHADAQLVRLGDQRRRPRASRAQPVRRRRGPVDGRGEGAVSFVLDAAAAAQELQAPLEPVADLGRGRDGTRVAASSSARGRPSRRREMSVTAGRLSAVRVNEPVTAAARWQNRATEGTAAAAATPPSVGTAPGMVQRGMAGAARPARVPRRGPTARGW